MNRKTKLVKRLSVGLVALVLAGLAFYKFLGIRSQKMVPEIGVVNGHLKPCPTTPNCVSTGSTESSQAFERLLLIHPAADLSRLIQISESHGGRVVKREEGYVHLEFKSAAMGFVDDLEFYIDPLSNSLEVRSASRVGASDLGVNRKRLVKLMGEFKAQK